MRPLPRILAAALGLRMVVVFGVLAHSGPAWFFARGSEMGFLAQSLLHGQGLSSPFGPPTGPTALVAPGYPLFTAMVFRLLGSYSWSAALYLMLLQACCNTATVLLIYKIAQRFATQRAATYVAIFWTCSLPLVWMPTIFWDTSLSCLLLTGTVWLATGDEGTHSTAGWAAQGALAGIAGLVNPALLPSLLLLAVCQILRAYRSLRWRRGAAVYLGVLTLVFAPWPVRNFHVFKTCVFTRTTVGLELWMGNHIGSSGYLVPSLFPTDNRAELTLYRQQGEIAYMAEKRRLAESYIQAHRLSFLLLSGRRCVRFWSGSGTQNGSPMFVVHAVCSTLAGFWGLLLLWQRGERRIFLVFGVVLLAFPLPYYITHAEFRYRLVVDPLLCMLAAPALEALFARRSQHQPAGTARDGILRRSGPETELLEAVRST